MVQGRVLTVRVAAVLAAATMTACTSSPAAQPVQTAPPVESSRSVATAAHRVETDQLVRQLDSFFADDAATINAFRDRRALLITVDGRPVVERYWHSSATATGGVFGITTTIMSSLVGVAIDEGKLRGVDQTLAELLPSYDKVMSRQVRAITLRQLLTMTSGLPGDEASAPPVSPGFSDRRGDWVRDILAQGVSGPPGHFSYSSAGSHLLSAILSRATGRSTLDYARVKLFDPLGIKTRPAVEPVAVPENIDEYERAGFAWPTDPQHRNTGDSGLKLTARDLAKVGQLLLQDGRWGDRQLVSAHWMRSARTDRVVTNDHVAQGYGYQLWLETSNGHDAMMARGVGGQLIEIVPDLGLVVVVQSERDLRRPDPGTAETWDYAALVAGVIVPTVH
jgi:CubicO group peptidase (beta-lactamase class C family)